jgi:peptidoglycan/xylan/chitin deacetylase (PgdA/CDA1 family)
MKKILKRLMAAAAYHLRLWPLAFGLYHIVTGRYLLVVFSYHRIVDSEKTKEYYLSYEKGLDATIFERHIQCIKRFFKVVSLEEFIELVTGQQKMPWHAALITVDDADSEYIRYVFPIIKEHKIDVVVFAPSGFVATGKQPWPVQVCNIIRSATKDHWRAIQRQAAELPENIKKAVLASNIDGNDSKPSLCLAINSEFDEVDHHTINMVIEQWNNIVKPKDKLRIQCMNWGDLQFLEQHRHLVESHTVNHYKLSMLTTPEIRSELSRSKQQLENELGKTIKAICYPQGCYNDTVCEIAREVGYQVGFTTQQSMCNYPISGLDLYKMPRLSVIGNNLSEIHFSLGKIAVDHLFKRKP